jgi:dihydrodipicolinate reductase
MAKSKKTKSKSKAKSKVVIERSGKIPKGRSSWPFQDMQPPNETGDVSVFYVDADEHQAIRTAASRAMKTLGITLSVRKIKEKDHKQFGRIGVYRTE